MLWRRCSTDYVGILVQNFGVEVLASNSILGVDGPRRLWSKVPYLLSHSNLVALSHTRPNTVFHLP
jgi:hypothetical protein